ncbi:MAG: hypothetical protein MPK13_09800, partial [Gammaproteobacteria bacterium]|nr:hypothetical protein [Gammaproteobacteria bacterium]
SFLAIFLFAAFPGAASAQGLKLRLDPADGVVNLKDAGGENCLKRQTVRSGRSNVSADRFVAPPGDCPVVRVTPYFENAAARPSERTIVKILPRTPLIRTTAVIVQGANTFEASQAAKDRVAAAKTARDAAFTTVSGTRGAARNAALRVYVAAVKEHEAAKNEYFKSKLEAERLAPGSKVITTDSINPDYRPEGYVPVRGDQYATLGRDYFLTDGQIVLNEDGTIDPPFFEVRALELNLLRDKTALFGLYVSTGDKKYGAVAAEFGVLFKAPPKKPNKPTVELYFVPDSSIEVKEGKEGVRLGIRTSGNSSPTFRGTILTKVAAAASPVRLKARLHDPITGKSIAADADIRLKLAQLPPGLLQGATSTTTYRAFAESTITYQSTKRGDRVYQPMQETLTIRAGETSAITADFLILPATGLAREETLPAPVIVDAAGDPVDTEIRTVGHTVTVTGTSRSGANSQLQSVSVPASQEVVETPTDSKRSSALGMPVVGGHVDAVIDRTSTRLGAVAVQVRIRADDTSSANSVDTSDFLRRNLDGSFVPLAAFADHYDFLVPPPSAPYQGTPPTNQLVNRHRIPVWLRHDGLAEGPETFKLRIANGNRNTEQIITIPANGSAELKAGYAAADGGKVSGSLTLKGEDFGIQVKAAGGGLTYENSGRTLLLAFTDTTGRDGSGAADGILSGDELSTTATWTFNSAQLALTVDSANLPANLQASQFPGATLPALPDAPPVVGFTEATALTVTESGATSDPVMQLQITPPLNKPATLEIVAIGKVGGNSLTATAAGEEFADVHAALEVQLPAGGGFDDPAVRVVEFPVSHVKDDQIVEGDETFQLALRVRPDDPFVIGGNTTRTITIKDDDTATFTVEASPVGQLRRGGTVTLTGRLSAALQVSGVIIGSDTSAANLSFSDGNSDGYISGAELSGVTTSLTVDSLLNGAEYNYSYSAIAPGSGLRDEAFLFPQRGDPGRAHLRWHANGLFALPKIAPRHAPGDHTFAGV